MLHSIVAEERCWFVKLGGRRYYVYLDDICAGGLKYFCVTSKFITVYKMLYAIESVGKERMRSTSISLKTIFENGSRRGKDMWAS